MFAFYIFFSIVLGEVVGVGVFFFLRYAVQRRFADSLQSRLFLIKIPRAAGDKTAGNSENADFKSELAHFEQLLGSLTAIKRPFIFEVAVPHVGEEIHFYLAVPKLSSETAIRQVQGLWNGASMEEVGDDFNIFNVNGATAAAYVKQKEHYGLPFRTYAELGLDSFESILGAFSKINEIGEGAAVLLETTDPEKFIRDVAGWCHFARADASAEELEADGTLAREAAMAAALAAGPKSAASSNAALTWRVSSRFSNWASSRIIARMSGTSLWRAARIVAAEVAFIGGDLDWVQGA